MINSTERDVFYIYDSVTDTSIENRALYVSMIYGSVNCFKYLLCSGYYDTPTLVGDICAIEGGNIEVIRILLQSNKFYDTNKLFYYIISRHNTELFKFWFNKFDPKNLGIILREAICYYAYDIFEYVTECVDIKEIMIQFVNQYYHHITNNFTRMLKSRRFEVVVKFTPNLIINYDDVCDEHFNYLYSHRDEFPELTKDSFDIIRAALTHKVDNVETFKRILTEYFTTEMKDSDVNEIVRTCLLYCEKTEHIKDLLEYLERLPINVKNLNMDSVIGKYICSSKTRSRNIIIDYILGKTGITKFTKYKYLFNPKLYIDIDIYADLMQIFAKHGIT